MGSLAAQTLLNDPADLTKQYNTQLSPDEEKQYQAWAQKYNKQNDTYDYDLRGWYKEHNGADPGKGHLNDKYKKPNHPTFSTESKYSDSGAHKGGTWKQNSNGSWAFYASQANLKYQTPDALKRYFSRVEKGNTVVLPGEGQ